MNNVRGNQRKYRGTAFDQKYLGVALSCQVDNKHKNQTEEATMQYAHCPIYILPVRVDEGYVSRSVMMAPLGSLDSLLPC